MTGPRRLTLLIPSELWLSVEKFRWVQRVVNWNQTVLNLIRRGLAASKVGPS